MAPVAWSEVDAHNYERMVGCLLSDLFQTRRVDGKGGDGGRDIYVWRGDELHIFECKSFTGRIGREQGRRKQVERSLARAMGHPPTSWTLVVPINASPAEEEWFAGLQATVNCRLDWFGEDWLDREVGKRPWLQHYFIERGADKAMRLLHGLREEQAGLDGGAPDAVARIGRIVDQLNDLDPFFTYKIAVDRRRREVGISARYPGAEEDRPITFAFEVSGDSPEQTSAARAALADAIHYGGSVELDESVVRNLVVDLPANLGGTFPTAAVKLDTVEEAIALRATAAVIDPSGPVLAAMPFAFTERRIGTRGTTLLGHDASGILRIRVVADGVDLRMTPKVSFHVPGPVVPSEVLPAVRLAAVMSAPNKLRITLPGGVETGDFEIGTDGELPTELLAVLEAVDRIQRAIGSYFEVPQEITQSDLQHIRTADLLLAGEHVEIEVPGVSATLDVHDAEPTKAHLLGSSPGLTVPLDEFPVRIFGVDIDLRPLSLTFESAQVAGGQELVKSGAVIPGAALDVVLRPEPGTSTRVQRVAGGVTTSRTRTRPG